MWIYCFVHLNKLEKCSRITNVGPIFLFLCVSFLPSSHTAPETHLWMTSSGEPVLFVQIPQKKKKNARMTKRREEGAAAAALHFTVWIHLIQRKSVRRSQNKSTRLFSSCSSSVCKGGDKKATWNCRQGVLKKILKKTSCQGFSVSPNNESVCFIFS